MTLWKYLLYEYFGINFEYYFSLCPSFCICVVYVQKDSYALKVNLFGVKTKFFKNIKIELKELKK